jgi:hypothetical protein
MQIIVTIDDELYERALALAEPSLRPADLFCEALEVFIQVQSAKRLAALGLAQHQTQENKGATPK